MRSHSSQITRANQNHVGYALFAAIMLRDVSEDGLHTTKNLKILAEDGGDGSEQLGLLPLAEAFQQQRARAVASEVHRCHRRGRIEAAWKGLAIEVRIFENRTPG
jgi:hypothetical protein